MAIIYDFERKKDKTMIANKRALTTIDAVADVFLTIEPMTHKKLQKLCYYAYSWYHTLYNGYLFDNRFEAWVHGPVDPVLYQKYKGKGWQNIPKTEQIPDIGSDIVNFVHQVYDSYGHLNGNQLEYLSHKEDPWLKTRGDIAEYEPCNERIKDEDIKRYYGAILENEQRD